MRKVKKPEPQELSRADRRFRKKIDRFVEIDQEYKALEKERELLRKELVRIIRYGHRGHGYHAGEERAINTYWVRRRAFSQAKARELMSALDYRRSFRTQKYVQLDSMELHPEYEEGQPIPKEKKDETT